MKSNRSKAEPTPASGSRLGRRRVLRLIGIGVAALGIGFKFGSISAAAVPSSDTVITNDYIDLRGNTADPPAQEGRIQFRSDMPNYRGSLDGVTWTSFEVTAHKGQPNGYADLDSTGKVPTAELGTGVADSSVFLRGDRTWSPTAGGPSTSVAFLAWNKFAVD